MSWSSELSEVCAEGDSVTFTTEMGAYEAGTFTAPKKGIYRFTLLGSGGRRRNSFGRQANGGPGGKTEGYLLLEKGQQVFVGCGGPCCAAWAASENPGNTGVWDIAPESLYFVAGGGGGGGSSWGEGNYTCGVGGAGGGLSGGDGGDATSWGTYGRGGTQTEGGAGWPYDAGNGGFLGMNNGTYGKGSDGVYTNNNDVTSAMGGDGGDGYYGGGAGASNNWASGGGGGSGYVGTELLRVAGRSYISTTEQGGGAASNSAGSVTVAYHAKAELPVSFDGVMLTKLIFNGVEVEGLIYNGVRIYARRCWACLRRMAARFGCPAAIPESFCSRYAGRRSRRAIWRSLPCAEGTAR